MKEAFVLAVLLGANGIAMAQAPAPPPAKPAVAARRSSQSPPPPIVIPQDLSPPQEIYAAFPEKPATNSALAEPSPCQVGLAKIATFHPIPMLVGPGECGAVDAVLLNTVILPDKTKIAVNPPATLRCPMAEQVAEWVRDEAAPETLKLGAALRGLDNFDSYECRGRNRVRGAKLSEHGRANALDVRGFRLADGRSIGLTDVNVDKDWRERIRASVCARFSTVLGPGSDGEHEEHIHLDLAERRNNYKICEWDVRVPIAKPQQIAPQAETEVVPPALATPAAQQGAPRPVEDIPLPRPRPLAAAIVSDRAHSLKQSDRD